MIEDDDRHTVELLLNKFKKNYDTFIIQVDKVRKEANTDTTKIPANHNVNPTKTKDSKLKHYLKHYLNKITNHNVCLLSETQQHDENQAFRKLMNLFLEETETIVDNALNINNADNYLILQLYTAFSSQSRKVFFETENIDETRKRQLSFCAINNVFFNKDKHIDNKVLEFINHNMISIEETYHNYDPDKEQPLNQTQRSMEIGCKGGTSKENNNEDNCDIPIIDAYELDRNETDKIKLIFEDLEEVDKKRVMEKQNQLNYRIRKFVKVKKFLDQGPQFFESRTIEEIEEEIIKQLKDPDLLLNKDDFKHGNSYAVSFIKNSGFGLKKNNKRNSFSLLESDKKKELILFE